MGAETTQPGEPGNPTPRCVGVNEIQVCVRRETCTTSSLAHNHQRRTGKQINKCGVYNRGTLTNTKKEGTVTRPGPTAESAMNKGSRRRSTWPWWSLEHEPQLQAKLTYGNRSQRIMGGDQKGTWAPLGQKCPLSCLRKWLHQCTQLSNITKQDT